MDEPDTVLSLAVMLAVQMQQDKETKKIPQFVRFFVISSCYKHFWYLTEKTQCFYVSASTVLLQIKSFSFGN